MRFSVDWLHDYFEAPLPAPAELARRLTASGFETGTWEAVPVGSAPDLPAAETERRKRLGIPLPGDAHSALAPAGIAPGSDAAIEVDITANRPDAMNHFGLAREIAAALMRPLRSPSFDLAEDAAPATSRARVAIEAPDLCPRYVGRVVTGLRVAPSPAWLRRRLEAIGLTTKNNLVDASNYVLFELGQPLHAFDLKRLAGGGVIVRRARAGEAIVTVVDRVEKKLSEGMLVIAEAGDGARPGRPAAIAGVMGGFETAISDATTDVLVESAWFEPRSVARTSRALGLRSDASQRFERGADPGMTLFAADRLAALLAELGGGRILAGAIDARASGTGTLPEPAGSASSGSGRRAFAAVHRADPIVLRTDRASALLGLRSSEDEAASRLGRLSIAATSAGDGRVSCAVPTWRGDLALEVDLIEEYARLGGYDAVPSTLPRLAPPIPHEGAGEAEDRARRALAAFGYREAITYSMLSRADDDRFGALAAPLSKDAAGPPLVIQNPISERWEVMRRSLLPGLAGTLAFNLARGREDLRLFEVATVHGGGEPPFEAPAAAIGAVGLAHDPGWPRPLRPYDLLDLTGAIEALVLAMTGERAALAGSGGHAGAPTGSSARAEGSAGSSRLTSFAPANGPFHPRQSFTLFWDGRPVGRGGRLSAEAEKAIESDRPLFVAEMLLTPFLEAPAPPRFRPLSRLNPVVRDLSFFVARETPFARIEEAVASAARAVAILPAGAPSYVLVDRFEGKSVPEGRVSYMFRFRFAPRERALTAEEINGAIEAIAAGLRGAIDAEIRRQG
jgi:phenylalanyl-tRNA synthetase beta chain